MATQICSGQTSYTNPNATLAVSADATRLDNSTVRVTLHWSIWTASSSLDQADRAIHIVDGAGTSLGQAYLRGSWAYNTSYSGDAVIDVSVPASASGLNFGCKVLGPGGQGGTTLTWDGNKGTNTGNPAVQYNTVWFGFGTCTVTVQHQIINVQGTAYSLNKKTTHTVTYGSTFVPRDYGTAIAGFSVNVSQTNVSSGTGFTVTGNSETAVYYTRNAVSISVNSNGGTGGTITWANGKAWYGGSGTLTPPTRQGYTFTGWTLTSGSFGLSGNTVTNVTVSGGVRANWRANTYTLTYNGNGGDTPAAKSVTYDAAYGALATSARRGYEFLGWFTSPTGGTQVTASTVCKGNSTVYAHWKIKILYDRVIIYTADGEKRLAKPYIRINGKWVGAAVRIGNGIEWEQTAVNPDTF